MTASTPSAKRVLVILDPAFGERLRAAWPGQPVWITMSSINEPVVRSLWGPHPEQNALTGITGFRFDASVSPADQLLEELDMIDLHHGAHSSSTPYTELEVVGASLTPPIRAALSRLGFAELVQAQHGFIATRSVRKPVASGTRSV